MESEVEGMHKCLPVDIRENDGMFTRAYVQDLLENGDILAHFDRAKNPVQTVKAEAVYEVYRPSEKEDFIVVGPTIDVLVRYLNSEPRRWFPARVLNFGWYSLIEVTFTDGKTRKTCLESLFPTETVRVREATRTMARFIKTRLGITRKMEKDFNLGEKFLGEWQKQMDCLALVQADDEQAKSLSIVASIKNPLVWDMYTQRTVSFERQVRLRLLRSITEVRAAVRKRQAD